MAAAAWQRMQAALAGIPAQDPAPPAPGASAILRLDGRVLGHGSALASADRPCVDVAIAQAILQAQNDASWLAWTSRPPTLAEAVTLELELTGEPEPLTGRTLADCAQSLRPALDAMAVRRGTTMHWMPASRLQSMGLAAKPTDGLGLLMRRAGLADTDLPSIDPAESVAVYRMQTIRLAQSTPGAAPWLVLHGERPVPTSAVSHDTCIAAAERAAAWLNGCILEEPGSPTPVLLGDYGTIADRRQPMVAGTIDRLMAAWAFAELAAKPVEEALSWRGRAAMLAAQASDADLDMLSVRRAVALRMIAWCALTRSGSDDERRAAHAEVNALATSLAKAVPEEAPADAVRALELAAAACAQSTGARVLEPTALHGAIARAWDELPRASLVTEAEWLLRAAAWAELAPPPSPLVQDALRDVLMRVQLGIGSASRELPSDLVGAFQLAASNGQPSVGATGLRPLAALVRMVDAAPDPDTRSRVREACRAGARFVLQLQVSTDGASLLRQPRRCVGGIRESMWEPRIRVAGTAAAILVLLDLAQTLSPAENLQDPS
ncbi:MAG: hypothetical protein FJ270_03040 [Planctomycetes bacterium]|nr:hypothetical protein [Planctomycetota bacterium]